MVETRPYFLIGDLLANAAVGALAASAVAWVGLPSWPMATGMLGGMILGMIIGLVASLTLLSLLFGAMEVFVPCMLGGMLAGMTGAMGPIGMLPPAATGALVGTGTLVLIYVANAMIGGDQQPGT